jgi:hypothetical protein
MNRYAWKRENKGGMCRRSAKCRVDDSKVGWKRQVQGFGGK